MDEDKEKHGGSSHVAEHYNKLPQRSLQERSQSRIFYLRNLNNWIKSMTIQDAINRIRREGNSSFICVLDLCCGKGGDLLKWKSGRIGYLVCADIAGVSVEQCKGRFNDLVERASYDRRANSLFKAEFITADCAEEDISLSFQNADTQFDLCSCQFSLHYCFSTEARARRLLANACERLKVGGYFIGTIPDANLIVRLLRDSPDRSFANEISSLRFAGEDIDKLPLFGATYHFRLYDVVDCPEYLVYFPLFKKMLEEFGMRLVYKLKFGEVIEKFACPGEGKGLMLRMQALEPYPKSSEDLLAAKTKLQYEQARKRVRELSKTVDTDRTIYVGTLSKDEWEVACMYITFMFQKIR
ncbi:mRNA cap guanine N7 methyltransferase [Trichuris trichiura]|uniref:mRNA cap guanine-N(7) methyltransferase n=1 Tax=Trichuris trichiura TaxID=36087 RepID=A0A077ZBP3_TRITR|nr:mRNA cap guanine N7 methyltransferase [Trichuris trichiura]